MGKCIVEHCRNRSEYGGEAISRVSFFGFPKKVRTKIQWVNAIGRADWVPCKFSRICSTHFEEKCFIFKKNGTRILTPDAIPTLNLPKLISLNKETQTSEAELMEVEGPSIEFQICELSTSGYMNIDSPTSDTSSTSHSFYSDVSTPSTSTSDPLDNENDTDMYTTQISDTDTSKKRKLKHHVGHLNFISEKRKKICHLQQNKCRKNRKIENLTEILEKLYEEKLLNNDEKTLLTYFEDSLPISELASRKVSKIKSTSSRSYSPVLRAFGLTLHYYSPRAYEYVRKVFGACLPHPGTIRKWYQSINGNPGFTKEAFQVLKTNSENDDERITVGLIINEMPIRQHVEWDGETYHGYVDCGAAIDMDMDNAPVAKEAFVFLFNSIKKNWKIPVGYFLVDGITGSQRASFVLQCLEEAHESNVDVVSLTIDGCPANVSMLNILGCSLDVTNFQTSFKHPITQRDVAVFLDTCHMLKLVRNCFASKKIFVDGHNNQINWNYLEELNHIHTKESLHLGTKLRKEYLNFHNNKMNIKLTTQLFSKSAADALIFCKNDLRLEAFENVDATVKFINLINGLFEILNSRNINNSNFKSPLHLANKEYIFSMLDEAKNYLLNLKTMDNIRLIDTGRKMGFIGLCCCIDSTKHLFHYLIEQERSIEYLPMYKFSQDHLELLFCNIGQKGGFNNNPTSRQFKAAYKKIITDLKLGESFSGNCIPLQRVAILECNCSIQKINLTCGSYRSLTLLEESNQIDEQYFFNISSSSLQLSEYSKYIITYIAGFVTRALIKKIKCDDCLNSLMSKRSQLYFDLIFIKDRGGLTYPSEDVIAVCQETEKVIKVFNNNKKFTPTLMKTKIAYHVLKKFLNLHLFTDLNEHQFDNFPNNCNHIIELMRAICGKYIDIRIHHATKIFNSMKITKRNILNKVTIFKGQ